MSYFCLPFHPFNRPGGHLHLTSWAVCLATQSCPTLCDPMDCSPPGSSVHGIFQARILEWVAMAFSRGILPTQGTNSGLLHSRQILYQLSHQGSPWILQWVCYPFSRGIFLTQESNWGLLQCRWILYPLSYQGSPSGLAGPEITSLMASLRPWELWGCWGYCSSCPEPVGGAACTFYVSHITESC